jgi:rubrerythrin
MTTKEDLEHLLCVESLHSAHFEEWERKTQDPLAKMVFRLAADKEKNHYEWVKLLIAIQERGGRGGKLGVSPDDLRFWVEDESGEGDSYEGMAKRAEEPWVKAVLRQIAEDERSNARMLKALLESAVPEKATA